MCIVTLAIDPEKREKNAVLQILIHTVKDMRTVTQPQTPRASTQGFRA